MGHADTAERRADGQVVGKIISLLHRETLRLTSMPWVATAPRDTPSLMLETLRGRRGAVDSGRPGDDAARVISHRNRTEMKRET